MDKLSLLKIRCDMEKSSIETLPENEIEEVNSSVGNSNTKETTPVTIGHMVIS